MGSASGRAAVLGFGPLRLYRYAHGRTAAEVVAAYNDLDPAGTATLRQARLYEYESWPATGRRPSARALAILARIYQTTAAASANMSWIWAGEYAVPVSCPRYSAGPSQHLADGEAVEAALHNTAAPRPSV